MTWMTIEQAAKTIGWVFAGVMLIFGAGVLWQKFKRGEFGDVKLSPMQQIAVDLAELSAMVKREIAELRLQIGTQFTDVVQRVNAHHTDLRELKDARNNEYERLVQKFYSKEIIDRRFDESEKDRNKLHAELKDIAARCDRLTGGRCEP